MSPDTDPYWVGALAMAAARAHVWIMQGRPERALIELTDILERLNNSPVMDDSLRQELAPYWLPHRKEEA